MEVITIGRSLDNDVVLNDSFVGRHHCQIAHADDGTFTLIDFNSKNGTYVNGKRIFGSIRLDPFDTVKIGDTVLPWTTYFANVVTPPKAKSNTFSLILGLAGCVLLAVVLAIIFIKPNTHKDIEFAFKGDYPDAVVVEMLDDIGEPYSIEAIEGQVCVWFEDWISFDTAKKYINASGGKIVAQIPDNGYYLVKVPANKVQAFLNIILDKSGVEWAYPNIISYPSMANTYILDNFNSRKDEDAHGTMVQYALQECGTISPLKTYNIGSKDGKYMNTNAQAFAMDSISDLTDDGPMIINMSFGPYLPKRADGKSYYWKDATNAEKKSYKESYLQTMRTIIKNAKKLDNKDYIIVKSAGNNGVKDFDTEIITYLRDNLPQDELDIMDKHFLIVTAGEKEQKHKDYSNEMEAGHYDLWVTKVDISDFKYGGKKRRGSSFAAPRAACILSSIANNNNLTGAEVLRYARQATEKAPDHVLTYDLLEKAIKKDQYKTNGCLSYRLIQDKTTDYEKLELRNTCNEDIRVTGYLLNTIASHGGANTLDFDEVVKAYQTVFVEGFMENECTITSVEKVVKKPSAGSQGYGSSDRPASGMGWYDYSATIAYSENLFTNQSTGQINLPNGDVIKYQYMYECDLWPEYYMTFTLGNGRDITTKYRVALVESLSDEQGYIGEDDDGFIDIRISYFGFKPASKSQMILLIRTK